MRTAHLSLACPLMPIHRYAFKHALTASEPMTATITLDNGTVIVIPNVTIPPTEVDRISIGHWRVRPCAGVTPEGAPIYARAELPAQETVFDIVTFTLTAKSITGPFAFVDGNDTWSGPCTWPDSPVDLFPLAAEPVTATGVLTLEGS